MAPSVSADIAELRTSAASLDEIGGPQSAPVAVPSEELICTTGST
jgi:hypothetical protein